MLIYLKNLKNLNAFDLKFYLYSIIKSICSQIKIEIFLYEEKSCQIGRAVKAVDLSPTGRKPA
jgi:hypothetical protein